MIIAVVLLWVVVVGILGYLVWDARAGWMDGEDTIRRMAREARKKRG
jgi:hypothetical protein